jgi:CRISPR-associated protein (TIGR02710 family)
MSSTTSPQPQSRQSTALVITVGTGPSVEHGIAFSIRQQNPDFILFICTPDSVATLDRQDLAFLLRGQYANRYDSRTITTEPNDAENLALFCSEVISEELIRKRRFRPSDISVDYTSGTKPMSAALLYAALHLGLNSLVYITGEKGPDGRTLSGTERVYSFHPTKLIFHKNRDRLLSLFNHCQFQAVISQIHDLESSTAHPDHKRELSFLKDLSKAYLAWDTLNIPEASNLFASLNKHFPDWIPKYRLKSSVETANRLLHLEKASDFAPERMLDLLANSDRRFSEGRYDQAAALLYRLLEFIAQSLLHQKGFSTSDIDLQKIPEPLRLKWEPRKSPDGKLKIGLIYAYELLADLNHPLGINFINAYKQPDSDLQKCLNQRNLSIFAHGFHPVSRESCENFRRLVCSFLSRLIPDYEDRLPEFQFPRLKPPETTSPT